MGLWATLLGLIGCAPGAARSPSLPSPPSVGEFHTVLRRQRVLRVDAAAATSGRCDIVPGDGAVLELHAARGRSRIAYDKGTDWWVTIEVPRSLADGALEVDLASVRACARVAGEDVLYLARTARGTLTLSTTGGRATGALDATFVPDRDLIKLGEWQLRGPVNGAVE